MQFGWPCTVYTEFGYDAATRMIAWTPEGALWNSLVAVAAGLLAVLALPCRPPLPRP